MDFAFTAEHEELRQTVRRFLEREFPEARVRVLMETPSGHDERIWKRMAEDWRFRARRSERYGGAGLGPVELGIVMEEMGRVLFCGPYLSTAVLSVYVLLQAATEDAKGSLLREVASGTAIVAALHRRKRPSARSSPPVVRRARPAAGAWKGRRISWSMDTRRRLARPRAPTEGLGIFRVEGDAPGLRRTALPALDLTRKLSRLDFSGAPRSMISAGDVSAASGSRARFHSWRALRGTVGGAQRCLETATEYAKTRLQFGRPIGSYQAIKHKCADMLVEVEFARSAAYHAAFRAAEPDDAEVVAAAHMAKAYCSEAYFHAAAEKIQIHGGMGFTWEHSAHLYFKRAKASAVLFGDPIRHRLELARQIGI